MGTGREEGNEWERGERLRKEGREGRKERKGRMPIFPSLELLIPPVPRGVEYTLVDYTP
jgi:hypothetical protein